jgi:hypothetical protein
MSLPVYFTFLLACAVVMIGPSPALTLIVASRPRHGRRVGMLNAAGIQLGLRSNGHHQRVSVSVVACPRNHFCYNSLTVPV